MNQIIFSRLQKSVNAYFRWKFSLYIIMLFWEHSLLLSIFAQTLEKKSFPKLSDLDDIFPTIQNFQIILFLKKQNNEAYFKVFNILNIYRQSEKRLFPLKMGKRSWLVNNLTQFFSLCFFGKKTQLLSALDFSRFQHLL